MRLADLGSAKQEEKLVLEFKFTKFLEKYHTHNIYKHSDHNFNVQYYRQLYFIDRQSNKWKGQKRDRIRNIELMISKEYCILLDRAHRKSWRHSSQVVNKYCFIKNPGLIPHTHRGQLPICHSVSGHLMLFSGSMDARMHMMQYIHKGMHTNK